MGAAAETRSPKARSPKPRSDKRGSHKSGSHETGTIEQSILVNASPLEAFRALAEPARHSAFTGARATGVARKGGRFTAFDGYIEGIYLAVDPGRRLAMSWRTAAFPKAAPPSLVEFRFAPDGLGTRVTLIQRAVPAHQVAKYRAGWIAHYWTPLKDYFDAR